MNQSKNDGLFLIAYIAFTFYDPNHIIYIKKMYDIKVLDKVLDKIRLIIIYAQ
jgi:hypothetical protein